MILLELLILVLINFYEGINLRTEDKKMKNITDFISERIITNPKTSQTLQLVKTKICVDRFNLKHKPF